LGRLGSRPRGGGGGTVLRSAEPVRIRSSGRLAGGGRPLRRPVGARTASATFERSPRFGSRITWRPRESKPWPERVRVSRSPGEPRPHGPESKGLETRGAPIAARRLRPFPASWRHSRGRNLFRETGGRRPVAVRGDASSGRLLVRGLPDTGPSTACTISRPGGRVTTMLILATVIHLTVRPSLRCRSSGNPVLGGRFPGQHDHVRLSETPCRRVRQLGQHGRLGERTPGRFPRRRLRSPV
jgi:hypothetical protein